MKPEIIFILIIAAILQNIHSNSKNSSFKMKLQYYSDKLNENSLHLTEKIAIIDSIITIKQKEHNSKEEVELLKKKSDLYLENGAYSTALNIYKNTLSKIKESNLFNNSKDIEFEILLKIGKLYYFLGKYDEGISYMYEILKNNNQGNPDYNIKAYIILSDLFIRMNKPDIAQNNLKKASEVLKSTHFSDSIITKRNYDIYKSMSSIYLCKNNYDSAMYYLEKARSNCKNSDDMNKIYQNMALLYINISEFKMAEEYFQKALNYKNSPYEQTVITNNLAILYYIQGQYQKALDLCLGNLKLVNQIDAAHVKSNLLATMSAIYSEKGDYKKALEYRDKGQIILDSIFDAESEQRVLLLNNDFEMFKMEQNKKFLEYKIQVAELSNFKKNVIILLFLALFLVVLAIVFIVSKKFIKQNRTKKNLEKQLINLDEDKNTIISNSQKHFETEISHKTRELTSNTMFVAKMCETANKVSENIKKLKKIYTNPNAEQLFTEIENDLNSMKFEEKGWDDFKLYFEQLHQSFFTNLNATHPDLTPGENRMCALIAMNLSTKEIASITNRSIRTIESSKFRIRKKLNIDQNTSTNTYLIQFL